MSIQERLFPTLPCFGCGPANPRGLQLRSYEAGPDVVAHFRPWPEHDNGLGYLNGGIISTVLDCHSAAVVTLAAHRNGWTEPGGPVLPFVTAGLTVRYLRPSPLEDIVELHGVVATASETEMTADVELWWEGKARATATATWKRWRPRP